MEKTLLIIILITLTLIALLTLTILPFTGNTVNSNSNPENLDSLTLQVSIPCPGHAGLIKNELYKAGYSNVDFRPQNLFNIYYNSSETSKEKILSLDIFKEYPAKEVIK